MSIYKPYNINNWVKDFCLEYNTGFQIEEYLRIQLREFIKKNGEYPAKPQWFRWLGKERRVLLMQKRDAIDQSKETLEIDKIITQIEIILNKDEQYRLFA